MKDYFDKEILPLNRALGQTLGMTIEVKDTSKSQFVYVRHFCRHFVIGGECVKCRIVIEDEFEEYDNE